MPLRGTGVPGAREKVFSGQSARPGPPLIIFHDEILRDTVLSERMLPWWHPVVRVGDLEAVRRLLDSGRLIDLRRTWVAPPLATTHHPDL